MKAKKRAVPPRYFHATDITESTRICQVSTLTGTKKAAYKSGLIADIEGNYSNVENIGFEPMTSCMPCKRSSQLS